MTYSRKKILFATSSAILCIFGVANIGIARNQDAQSRSVSSTAGATTDAQRVKELNAAAKAAEEKINASKAEKDALLRATTPAEIKAVLMRNGFTAAQLKGVGTLRSAASTKGAEAARIKITVRCCPLEIIISW